MALVNRFSDCFWGTDFCSSAGIEALDTRLKEGQQTLKDFEEYLKQRKKIEDDYAKALMKLAGVMGGKQELGSLRNAYESLKDCIEDIAHIHFDVEKALDDEIIRVNKLAERQRNERRSHESKVEKSHNKKKSWYKKTFTAKQQYEAKCKELDVFERNANMLKQSSSTQKKDLDKATMKALKWKEQTTKCDTVYANAIQYLEASRTSWENEMEQTCEKFQDLEEERIVFLRNEIWAHTNILSQVCVMDDNDYEKVRLSLESCKIQDDINEFIQRNMTGTDRPAAIVYESYHYKSGHTRKDSLSNIATVVNHNVPSPSPTPHFTITENHHEDDDYSDSEFDDDYGKVKD